MLLHCVSCSPIFRDVWVKHVCKQSIEPGLVREVSWPAIEEFLFSRIFEQIRRDVGETAFSQSRLIMYKLFQNELSPFGDEIATLQHYGRIVGYFPPLITLGDGKWVSTALALCSQRWFWGDSSRLEVEHYLRGSPTGTFVVRFANQSSFRLSIQLDANTTKHFVVAHGYASLQYRVKVEDSFLGVSLLSSHLILF